MEAEGEAAVGVAPGLPRRSAARYATDPVTLGEPFIDVLRGDRFSVIAMGFHEELIPSPINGDSHGQRSDE
jgi:hypothetical protein